MKNILFQFLVITTSIFSGQSFDQIIPILYDDTGWKLVTLTEHGLSVYNKQIFGTQIPAIKVTYEAEVNLLILTDVIKNGQCHTEFLKESYLSESIQLQLTPNTFDAYQHLELPFLTDRHYISRSYINCVKSHSHIRMNWEMLPDNGEYENFLIEKNNEYGEIIYIDQSYGGWEVIQLDDKNVQVNYRIYLDPGGWVPDFLVNRSNQTVAPKTVYSMVKEAKRQMIEENPE